MRDNRAPRLALELLVTQPLACSEVLVTRHARWIVLLAVLAASAVLPAEAFAQRRGPVRRPAVRPVYVSARPYYYYRPYYYSPFYYSGFGGWYSGFGWYPYPHYGYYGPYPYRYYGYNLSSARIQVKPRHAEVFVDGYFVGTVDDFDGWSQRLNVEPGEHEVEIYLAGHRSYRQPVLFRPGATIRIEHVMQPLAAGDQEDARPRPSPTAPARTPYGRDDPDQGPPPRRVPAPPPQRGAESQDYGAIEIRVQPADAEVIVDGDRWESPAGDVTLQLTEGTHRVEVRRSGYRTYSAEIRVRRGETTSVNVSLSRQ